MKYDPHISKAEVLIFRITASKLRGTSEAYKRGLQQLVSVRLAYYNFIFTELSGSSASSVLTKYTSLQLNHAVQFQYVFFPRLFSAASAFMGT